MSTARASQDRAHSKFSASGSETWLNCAASVALQEAAPAGVDTVWSVDGTEAHDVHEIVGKIVTNKDVKAVRGVVSALKLSTNDKVKHALTSWGLIFKVIKDAGLVNPEILIEKRIHNSDIHPEMFGTGDAIVFVLGGELHIFDYKYGQGHIVNPKENTQMIQYALGVAAKYEYNFSEVVVHIIQPRGGGNIHKFWGLSIGDLKNKWRPLWLKGVARVESGTAKPFVGSHCYWCRAGGNNVDKKVTCPAKKDQIQESRHEKVINKFTEGVENESENEGQEIKPKNESQSGKKAREAFNQEIEAESENVESWF